MEKFIERYKLSKLTQEEIGNQNKPIIRISEYNNFQEEKPRAT